MSEIVIYTIITVSGTGALAAVILYFVAQKFKVFEDPRIDEVEAALPSANCGGCGYPGCRNFAEACVKATNLDDLYCPVGGNDSMKAVATILGMTALEKAPEVAVIRCSGSPQHRKRTSVYDGATSCAIESALYSGDTDCQFGCLGHGDCVTACDFEAIYINPETLLPEVIDDNCTACGACVTACPKNIIELRPKAKKDRKIFVSCINTDKGAVTKKACDVGCIGCTKCMKVCPHDAITIDSFLAYIDPHKCKLCRKCVEVCPTSSILEINFPERKMKKTDDTKTGTKKAETTEKAVDLKQMAKAKNNEKPADENKPHENKQNNNE